MLWGGGYAAARFLTGSFAAGLAREISAAAARLQAPADPAAVQHVQVAIDALDIAKARPFWHSVLGSPQPATRMLKRVRQVAGIGDGWTPRQLRI